MGRSRSEAGKGGEEVGESGRVDDRGTELSEASEGSDGGGAGDTGITIGVDYDGEIRTGGPGGIVDGDVSRRISGNARSLDEKYR